MFDSPARTQRFHAMLTLPQSCVLMLRVDPFAACAQGEGGVGVVVVGGGLL